MLYLEENRDQSVTAYAANKKTITFHPDIDLDLSVQLLKEFNEVYTMNGSPIYESWKINEYRILPALQETLFWDCFVPIVQYKKLRDYLKGRKFKIKKNKNSTNARLFKLYTLLNRKHNIFLRLLFNIISKILRATKRPSSKVLIYDDGYDGFRFKAFKEILATKISYDRTEQASIKNLFSLISRKKHFFIGKKAIIYKKSSTIVSYNQLKALKSYLTEKELTSIIQHIENRFQDIKSEYFVLKKYLSSCNVSTLICYDQIEAILALVIACKEKRIKVQGLQHGPITEYHSGWLGYNLPRDICNLKLDRLYTWGHYWKSVLEKRSNKYGGKDLIVGAHLNKDMSLKAIHPILKNRRKNLKNKLNILVPYEFISNSLEISFFLEAFLKLGWRIYIKIRPPGDGDLENDKFAYSKTVRRKAIFKYDFSEKELATMNVAVGTQSVYFMEMMKYGLPLWYLKTSTTFLRDTVKIGLAHEITKTNLKELKDPKCLKKYLTPLYNNADRRRVFSEKSLSSLITKEILSDV